MVPYGGNPWKLDQPDISVLAEGAVDILLNQEFYRKAARNRAETHFGLENMVDSYLDVLLG